MGNTDKTEQRRAMGDPIHAQPAIVIYGGTVASPNLDDAVAYLPTNDGYLHAMDTVNGEELWSFIPQEFLPLQYDLFMNNVGSSKSYALDGEIRVLKFDVNGDGIVTPGDDRVILYFGMGRGGNGYYALDVTDKDAPRFMWRIGSTELPGVGQTWSTPTIAPRQRQRRDAELAEARARDRRRLRHRAGRLGLRRGQHRQPHLHRGRIDAARCYGAPARAVRI